MKLKVHVRKHYICPFVKAVRIMGGLVTINISEYLAIVARLTTYCEVWCCISRYRSTGLVADTPILFLYMYVIVFLTFLVY